MLSSYSHSKKKSLQFMVDIFSIIFTLRLNFQMSQTQTNAETNVKNETGIRLNIFWWYAVI